MGSTHIEITHVRPPSPSVASEDGDPPEDGVQVSPPEISPQYSVIQAQSHSGSSSHPGDFVHVSPLVYPSELAAEVRPADSASRLDSRERRPHRTSRSTSRRGPPLRQAPAREAVHSRSRPPPAESPTESGDSAEDFLEGRQYVSGMGHPRTYQEQQYAYPPSNSSGSFQYPVVPHGQVVHFSPHPVAPVYPPQQYQQLPPGAPVPFPTSHPAYGPAFSHHPGSQLGSPYGAPGYPPSVYPPSNASYFPQYAQPFPQAYPQQYPAPYAPQVPPPSQYMEQWRVNPPQPAASPSERSSQDDLVRRMEQLMKEREDDRKKREEETEKALKMAAEEREKALKAAAEATEKALRKAAEEREKALRDIADKAAADALAKAERVAVEARIREEATVAAVKAAEAKARAEAERDAREQRIRQEAAEEALRKAEKEAKSKAEKAAAEKKIAEDAAAAAKSEAEKAAADAAAKVEGEARKAQEEAEKKLKEAEEVAVKAKAEAEAAQKDLEAAKPPDKKKPVRFKDAIGRCYNFPFERCRKWRDMEGLIIQAFAHIDVIGEHVLQGHYDLIGPDKEIIMPNYWESQVEPDMNVTMMLWPLPEPKKEEDMEPLPPPLDGDVLDLDAILNGPKRERKGPKKKPNKPGALASWMMGGAPPRKSGKGEKKPDVAAGSQHGSSTSSVHGDGGACSVM